MSGIIVSSGGVKYGAANGLVLNNNTPLQWRNTSGSLISVLVLDSSNNVFLRTATSDGADSSAVTIASGGTAASSRGAYIVAYGNEASGAGGRLELSAGAAGSTSLIRFSTAGSDRWTIDSNGRLVFAASQLIMAGSSDGADNISLSLCGGGSTDPDRGAYAQFFGNEASPGGYTRIYSGSISGAGIIIAVRSSNGEIDFQTNNQSRWKMDSSGTLTSQATNGGNIRFSKSFSGVTENLTTVAAAGSSQSDATAIGASLNYTTGADGVKGIKLTALSGFAGGHILKIHNASASVLKLYSNAAGELINGVAGTTAYSIPAWTTALCFKYNSTNWAVG